MSESGISPLAKRLAEENNVNWRGLKGSGDGGKVVERDVLEYLARVMSGEEATNPTAEPVPEGMEAWPEEDMADFSTEQVTAGGSDESGSDDILLDEGFTFEDEEPLTSGETVQAQASQPSDIDEDIFLFDDELDDGSSLLAGADEASTTNVDDDLFKTLDDESGLFDVSAESTDVVETPVEAVVDDMISEEISSGFGDVLEAADESIGLTTQYAPPVVSATPPPITDLPVLLQGKVLRRHIQVGDLLAAQESIAKELNIAGLSLTVFLTKAVAKALESHPLGTGSDLVLMNVAGQKFSLHSMQSPLNKDIEAVINILNEAKQSEVDVSNASLLVADLSDNKLDEVMLSKEDVPVLSLGSISSEGNSTLSLSGNVLPDQSLAFLERVTELLSEPIRLVV